MNLLGQNRIRRYGANLLLRSRAFQILIWSRDKICNSIQGLLSYLWASGRDVNGTFQLECAADVLLLVGIPFGSEILEVLALVGVRVASWSITPVFRILGLPKMSQLFLRAQRTEVSGYHFGACIRVVIRRILLVLTDRWRLEVIIRLRLIIFQDIEMRWLFPAPSFSVRGVLFLRVVLFISLNVVLIILFQCKRTT